jgi:hypothetical protein
MGTFADGVACAGTDIEFQVIGGLFTQMPMPMPMLASSWPGSAGRAAL